LAYFFLEAAAALGGGVGRYPEVLAEVFLRLVAEQQAVEEVVFFGSEAGAQHFQVVGVFTCAGECARLCAGVVVVVVGGYVGGQLLVAVAFALPLQVGEAVAEATPEIRRHVLDVFGAFGQNFYGNFLAEVFPTEVHFGVLAEKAFQALAVLHLLACCYYLAQKFLVIHWCSGRFCLARPPHTYINQTFLFKRLLTKYLKISTCCF
jgi:hypothetical protein